MSYAESLRALKPQYDGQLSDANVYQQRGEKQEHREGGRLMCIEEQIDPGVND